MLSHVMHPSAAQTCASHVRQLGARDSAAIACMCNPSFSSQELLSLDSCAAFLSDIRAGSLVRMCAGLRCNPG